jgi:hypothetical protein
MNSASHTTARVVQPELQPQLQSHLEGVSSHCAGFKVRFKGWISAFFDRHVPYGYEDENGFHLGAMDEDSDSALR